MNRKFGVSLLAIAFVEGSLLWQGRMGFQFADEGWLWYGVQRVMKGEVPMRDFMSYDIGRYYWCAAFMSLWHNNGIMALRYVVALFQVIGLFGGLLVISQSSPKSRSLTWLCLAATTIGVWMFPRHKLFDAAISIGLVALLTFLAVRPTVRRYFVLGIGVGLSAVFGRNHGVYGVVGSLVLIAVLFCRQPGKAFMFWATGAWICGIAVGYLPNIAMLAFRPGFGHAFWESVRFLFEAGTTNLTLPAPWPWRLNFKTLALEDALRGILIGVCFAGLLVFGLLGMLRVIWSERQRRPVPPAFLASVALAVPYAHYSFSRADVGHLALGIFPMLLGCFVGLSELSKKMVRWPLGALLCAGSLFVILPFHPGWQARTRSEWSFVRIGRDTLFLDPTTARDAALLQMLTLRFATDPSSTFLAIPIWPGSYAMMDRKAPDWECYALWPRSGAFQSGEIGLIEAHAPAFVLLYDFPQDNREELRFSKSHGLLYRYLETHYHASPDIAAPGNYQLLFPDVSTAKRTPVKSSGSQQEGGH